MELSSPKLKKTPVFFSGEPLGLFTTVSSNVFILPQIFTIAFRVFLFHQLSLLWLFSFCQVLHVCVIVSRVLRIWESIFLLSGIFFLRLLSYICYGTARATDLREPFLLSGIFLPYTHSSHLPKYSECYVFQRALFTVRCFLPYTPSPHLPQYRECFGYERAFFILRGFYLTLLPYIWHNLLLSRLPWEPTILPWRSQIRRMCLFESHSVQ